MSSSWLTINWLKQNKCMNCMRISLVMLKTLNPMPAICSAFKWGRFHVLSLTNTSNGNLGEVKLRSNPSSKSLCLVSFKLI